MKKKGELKAEFQENIYFEDLISSFDRFLDSVRGLALSTRKLYCYHVRIFLQSQLKGKKSIDLIRPQEIIKFILSCTKTIKPRSVQHITCSLRSFLDF